MTEPAPLPRTLAEAVRMFARAKSPRAIGAVLVAAGAGRVIAGGFGWVDLAKNRTESIGSLRKSSSMHTTASSAR